MVLSIKQEQGFGFDMRKDKIWCDSMEHLMDLIACAPKLANELLPALEKEEFGSVESALIFIEEWFNLGSEDPTFTLAILLTKVIQEVTGVTLKAVTDFSDSDNVILAYPIGGLFSDEWLEKKNQIQEIFGKFIPVCTSYRAFPQYVSWIERAEPEKSFVVDTPIGQLKVYAKDNAFAHTGIWVEYVGSNAQCSPLACVEFEPETATICTDVYPSGKDKSTERTCHKDLDISEVQVAKYLINCFCNKEYGHDSLPDMEEDERISLAFTMTTDELLAIHAFADLENCTIKTFIEGFGKTDDFYEMKCDKYSSLAAMNEDLRYLDFEDLISIPEKAWERFCKSPAGLRWLRETFPEGTRIKLDYMEDIQAPPRGALGTVDHIDDYGNIHMRWDTGGSLALCYGHDEFYIQKEEQV